MGLVPVFRKFFQARAEFFTFLLTLFATFIGVFWAIEFNNSNQEKIETENAVKLLNAAKYEIKNKIVTHEMYYEIINNKLSSYSANQFIKHNPVEQSNLFQTTISNELILRKISGTGIQELHSCNDNLFVLQNGLNSDITSTDSIVSAQLRNYIKLLKLSIQIMDLEVSYLEGNIPKDKIENKYDSLFTDFNKEQNIYDLDSAIEQKKK